MFDFIVLSTPSPVDATLAIAASRAGSLGVLDLQFARDPHRVREELTRISTHGRGRWGAQLEGERGLAAVLDARPSGLDTVLLTGVEAKRLGPLVELVHKEQARAFVVATDLEQARAAKSAGADAVIAKGSEAGGFIGEHGAFVLLQQILSTLQIPVWVQGGIGPRTASAAFVAGAAGAVLDGQVLLAREARLPDATRAAIASMDGSETVAVGAERGAPFRVYSRPGLAPLQQLHKLAGEPGSLGSWRSAVKAAVGDGHLDTGVFPLGQDASFAAECSERFGNVAGILAGLRAAIADAARALQDGNPLAQGAPLARAHGTRYPIVQGPMTRVSDRAEFAGAVAEAGGLPLLALALMRGSEADTLLDNTHALLADRPWGVGILGFVPPELRAEQLEVVRAHRPPFALIAGGRPDQAHELEHDGITTYLHVPSPGLLRLYLADGARRFVFEGRECGGHVGPRTSFVLWETMLRVLLEELPQRALEECHVLFAGGVHDARSAAMVAAAAAPAAKRGIRIGVLLGTAYLFTREATAHGAITDMFQRAAITATDTVLLESGPGHATRCLASPFAEHFEAEKQRGREAELSSEELRERLEVLNIGRLRIAAKGVDRNPRFAQDPDAPKLLPVAAGEQWEQGMFMIGQVAALRDEVTTLADLHRDVADGSSQLVQAVAVPAPPESPPAPEPADVAIVGLGCILPGAPDATSFWSNILDKVDAIREIPADRWDVDRMYDPDPNARDKVYSRWGGFIDPVPFDPIALGLPPKSLTSIEPFQLLALLCAQAALRDAGYERRAFARDRTSVILGAGGGGADLSVGYTVRSALPSLLGDEVAGLGQQLYERLPEWTEDSFAGLLMNVAAGRIANRLDFGGTNYTVDAACASSLTAINLGSRELQMGTSDMVLAGGVDAIQNPFAYLCFAKTYALSPRGRCRPFDATADGIAISEGFATVVLKRLADAERDGDRIYAVVRGVGAASDGRDRSLTAPRPEGQMNALRRAYAQARVSPATVGLIEAHGTGTVAGDGAEVKALSTVFSEHRAGRQSCAIGSVKSMIGHTKATAGVAGIVKAALALHHRVLPPTIGVTQPNPSADFAASPFYVNTEARPWLTGGASHPRRAGVSGFGFGGTDFHIVLEEYTGGYGPDDGPVVERLPGELFLWRGAREEIAGALDALGERLVAAEQPSLASLAHEVTLKAAPPAAEDPALSIVAESIEDLRGKLDQARALLQGDRTRVHAPNGIHWAERPLAGAGKVAFLFPGQGSQTVGMARELAVAFPEARQPFEDADQLLADRYPQPLSRYIFPPPTFTAEDHQRNHEALTDTHVAQPALGAAELAYLGALASLGVRAEMTAGHSYGEFVALGAAGALDEEGLLAISEARGRFMAEAAAGASGAMAAVDAAPEALAPVLSDGDLVAANLNAPEQTVLSGAADSVERALEWCRERGIRAAALPVACAFHSPHVAAAQRRLAELLDQVRIEPPRIPVYSNTTGGAHASEPDEIARVLGEHLARPVEFVREIEAMYADGARVFIEVGPRSVVTGLVGRILGDREHLAVEVDRGGRSGLLQLLHCLAAIAVEGVPVAAERLFRGRPTAQIGQNSPAPKASWLLDGGRVRPAAESLELPRKPLTPPEEQPVVSTLSTNGAGTVEPGVTPQPPAPPSDHAPPRSAMPAAVPGPASGERVGEVMTHYQRVMQQFLETQRTVMVSYLNGARGLSAGVVSPASAPPMPAVGAPAPALPPPVAAPAPALSPAAETMPAPVPAAETAPAPAATEAPGDPLTREQIQERLLAVVSERTGYPAEMLALDADLEGDLGIDSIKRVEIAGTFNQSIAEEARAAIDMEQLTASRTLGEVIATLQAALVPAEGQPSFEREPAETERIGRFVLQASSAPEITAKGKLAPTGAVIIVDDGSGAGERLARLLSAEGEVVLMLPAGSEPSDAEDASALAVRLGEEQAGVKALIHLAAPDEEYGGLARLFLLAQALREPLEAAAGAGGSAVLGVTRLGGAFGVDGDADGHVGHGAIPGFLKALSLEWPAVRVKAIDLPANCERAADYLRAELFAADGVVEVGYRDDERTQLSLVPASLDRDDGEPLSGESVVLLTGGARGITAEVALSLAAHHRPTLLLVGRTPLTDEPPETASLAEVADLRAALIEARTRSGQKLTPALVEEDCRRILREREVRHNLTRLQDLGARVEYVQCDVADEVAFERLIDRFYERYGRIDCVVHGAGLIEDRLIRDKRLDSLQRVLGTKAGAALTLARKLRPDSLRALVLFGSVAGRFGNRGQADYGAASEVLAKLAAVLDRRWSARVVSIEWGPWRSTGMVSPLLEQEFERRGVALIDIERGCQAFEQELRAGGEAAATVAIGASTGLAGPGNARQPLFGPDARIIALAGGGVEAARSLRLAHDRYLDDHRVDGEAVLPFAVAMELMAELAIAASPGQALAGLRTIRLLKGISVPDDGSTPIRLIATPAGNKNEVEVTVGAPGTDRLHYRATVQLGAAQDSRPPAPLTDLTEFPMSVADAYRDLLFHGPMFQVIEAIDGLDGRGATARLRPSDARRCVADADGLRWLLDPVMLDGALQVQVLWARLQWDVTLLPAEIGSYTHLADPRPGEGVRHELRIRPESEAPMCHADHWFFGEDGRPLATLGDVVGVGTRALNRLAVASA